MKITKLVILFNYKKILLGILVSVLFLVISYQANFFFSILLKTLSAFILINILASIFASYILYDKSDLYTLNNLRGILDFEKIENVVLIHASFDPLSKRLEDKHPNLKLTVCDIFENRHEHESGIKISKKVFPPNPKETKIIPSQLPFEDKSQDIILAITAPLRKVS
ncbi:hypothetical protein [Epilithonimonas tenax]|uniref:hypothetical protein n=1 Tax=Epilithonimonas tenax TaxID=191577 RepID=UPI00048484C6|nr:hypothetical protein [Epilithonimonas tenax]